MTTWQFLIMLGLLWLVGFSIVTATVWLSAKVARVATASIGRSLGIAVENTQHRNGRMELHGVDDLRRA